MQVDIPYMDCLGWDYPGVWVGNSRIVQTVASSCLLGLIRLLFFGGESRKCGHDGLRGLLSGVKMTHGDLTQFIQYLLLQCSQENTGDSRLLRCFLKKTWKSPYICTAEGSWNTFFLHGGCGI